MQQPARREAAIGPTRPEWKVCSIFTPEFVARLREGMPNGEALGGLLLMLAAGGEEGEGIWLSQNCVEAETRLRDDQVRRTSKARRTDQNGSRFNPTSSAWAPPTLPTQRFPQDVTSRSR